MKKTERQEENLYILELLRTIFLEHPELRFNQVIWNLNEGKDCFYEEPDVLVKKLEKCLGIQS